MLLDLSDILQVSPTFPPVVIETQTAPTTFTSSLGEGLERLSAAP